jgi:hypothetical protein
MSLVQRFTRDSASKYVWGALLLVGILGVVFAFTAGSDAVRDERLRAERRAVAAADEVLGPSLEGVDLATPVDGRDLTALRGAIADSIGTDARVARVAVWSAGGELLFSTDRTDNIGSNEALNDELLQRAATGDTLTRWNVSDVGGTDEVGRSLLRTYTPLRSGVVAEIDHAEDGTVGPVAAAWWRYRIVAAAAAAFFLLMTILALRDPLARINTGVRFSTAAIPDGYELIDEERLHAVEEVYRLAHDRVAKLEARLSESEQDRRRLEGVLQRALTSASTGAPTPAPPEPLERPIAPAEPTAPSPAVATATPSHLIQRASQPVAVPSEVPDAEPKRRRSRKPAPAPAEERPAASVDVPPPVPAPAEMPPAPAPVIVPEIAEVEEIEEVEEVADVADVPEVAPVAEVAEIAEVVTVPDSDIVRPEKPRRQRLRRRTEPVAAIATDPDVDTDAADAAAHEAALETFIRLTERDRQPHEAAEVDQGAVRAALARTAARKKPGSAKLQPHEVPAGEVEGGGPRRDRS